MKKLLLVAVSIFLVCFLAIPLNVLPEESLDVSETYINLPCEEQWNLNSDKFKEGMKNDWDVLKVITYEFINLSQQGKLPGLSSESIDEISNFTFFKLNQKLFNSLKSESSAFTNLPEEFGEDEDHYLAELICEGKELKYFMNFFPQSGIEIKAAYINRDGSWERLSLEPSNRLTFFYNGKEYSSELLENTPEEQPIPPELQAELLPGDTISYRHYRGGGVFEDVTGSVTENGKVSFENGVELSIRNSTVLEALRKLKDSISILHSPNLGYIE